MQQIDVTRVRMLMPRPACQLCPSPATADSPWCSEHLADAVEREKSRIRKARSRKRHRDDRRCIDCGKKSNRSRCPACHRKKRQGVTQGVTPTVKLPQRRHHNVASRTRAVTEGDGRTRNRGVGKGKRGHPSRADEDAWCLQVLRSELALAGVSIEASHTNEVKDLPPIQRDAVVNDALSHLGLLERQLDVLVDRLKRRLR
jgi:predicted nucleic acid-binding Zn ribbon protein